MDRMQSRIMEVTLGSALLISPDHLRYWGNLAGQTGSFSLVIVFAAVLILWPSGKHYHFLISQRRAGSHGVGRRHWGGPIGIALLVVSRIVLATGLSTGVLVTAGFVFNETFLYWFPNFDELVKSRQNAIFANWQLMISNGCRVEN